MPPTAADVPIEEMSVEERRLLLDRLQTSLMVDNLEGIPDWHRELLDARLAESEANPKPSIPWEQVRKELFGIP